MHRQDQMQHHYSLIENHYIPKIELKV